MPVTFNNVNDPQATQAQEPKNNLPGDKSRESTFASLMQNIGKDKGTSQGSQASTKTAIPTPAPGTNSERIYNAVMTSSEKYNLPPALVFGFIKQESGFKPNAKSWCGAQGLMQLMPGTAKQLGVQDAWNIEQNVDGGCKYIRQMLDKFDGDLPKAIAAYNAGPGAVQKYGGIPPFKETKAYVPAVLAHAEKFNNGAPIVAPADKTVAVAVAAPAPKQTIDYGLVIDAIQTSDAMNQAALSLSITANAQPLELPKSERSGNDDPPPPPPPPPRGVRV
ncbi:MAG TPA: lytic transglycosylase domain-containing protein [bacterium]|nr:lytic transglycosylase domain-containing protein [bacterium]